VAEHPSIHWVVIPSRGLSGWKVKVTTNIKLVPRLRMIGTIPVLPVYAFMAWAMKTSYFTSIGYCMSGKPRLDAVVTSKNWNKC